MSAKFFFDEKRGDKLMSKINLRNIDAFARHWEHPVRGMLKTAEIVHVKDKDILKAPKKIRELYCISLLAIGLQDAHKEDWWFHIPESDPPDGLVGTFYQEQKGIKGFMREVEVVEHRDSDLFVTLENKLKDSSYTADTIFVCIVFSSGLYNFDVLSQRLQNTRYASEHIFLVFGGSMLGDRIVSEEDKKYIFSLVQVSPKFIYATFDLRNQMTKFEEKYKMGQELRLIENGQIFYGTTNINSLKR